MQIPIQIPLPIPYGVGPVNSYLFLDPEPTLIDCGLKTEECWAALNGALATHGLTVADIRRVVITHAHVDHIGLANTIVAHSDAVIWVTPVVYPWAVAITDKWPARVRFLLQTLAPFGLPADQLAALEQGMNRTTAMWDAVPAERMVTFPLDGTLELGGLPWQVIYTPGHSNTQSCFYQAETGQFLAADMLLAVTPTPVIEEPLEGDEREPGLPLFLDSLALVESLEIDMVYPGHGDPFRGHRELIERQSARIAERTEQCYALIDAGQTTFGALLEAMYGHQPTTDRFPAMGMLLGYLDLLEGGGLIKGRRQDGVIHFRPTT